LNCFEGFLEHTGKIIGVYKNNIYQEREFELQIGDKFLLFTDGLYEQFNPDKMEYGLITLLQLIQEKRRLRTSELLEVIFKDIQEFIGPDNKIQEHDDITVISLEITKDKLRGTV
ncbi:MAG: serine/threonine-protein phosphatase, partial [Leptospiraceae bacterium]|nr:serine/threonine-protein phosphatase [Leptospiraceae bacterium]